MQTQTELVSKRILYRKLNRENLKKGEPGVKKRRRLKTDLDAAVKGFMKTSCPPFLWLA